MNDKKTRRGGFAAWLPYVFTGLILFFIVFFIVQQSINTSWTISEGELDSLVGYNITQNKVSVVDYSSNVEDAFYVRSYTVSQKANDNVTVQGTFYNVKNPSKNRGTFTVVIEQNRWVSPFDIAATSDSAEKKHMSYSAIFEAKLEEWDKGLLSDGSTPLSQKFGPSSKFTNDVYAVSFWDTWGPTIIQGVLLVGFALFIWYGLSRSMSGANRQAMDFNKSPARRENASKVRFSDVAGCDEEKAEMVEMVEYLKEPKKYSKFGARLPKGVLLIGAPGTGKTLLAKAVAGEAGVPFFSISGSDFVEMFVGVGAGRVRDLFKKAKQSAPCIVFIDEIDAVGRQRGAGLGGGNDEREQTLNQLLVEMDGFEYNSGILVMAATNRSDVLDPALMRPGRFDRIITVSLPNKEGREAILKVHARNKTIDPSVNFKALAERTVGFSGADLENILNEAAILAVRFNKPSIGMAEIDEAIDRRIAGPAKSNKGLSEKERRQVAFHEAGHAVAGLVLPHAEKVQKITIIPRGNTGGHVLMTPEDDRFLLTKNELLAQITGLLAGRVSEEIFFDDISTGASNDIQEATKIARAMVTEYGMSELGPIQYERNNGSVFLGRDYMDTTKNFSTQVAYEIDKAVRDIIDRAHEEAKKLLTEHAKDVTLIAETLLAQETITAEEIESLVKTGSLPKKVKAEVQETSLLSKEEKDLLEGKETPKEVSDEIKKEEETSSESLKKPAEPEGKDEAKK